MSNLLGPNHFKIVKNQTVYSNDAQDFTVKEAQVHHKTFDGRWIANPPLPYVFTPDKLAILPYDPYENKVICIEHFRVGAIQEPDGPWHLEIPSDNIKPQETHALGCERILLNQIYLEPLALESLGSFYACPTLTNQQIFLYVSGVDSQQMHKVVTSVDTNTDQVVESLKLSEAIEAIHDNYFHNPQTIIGIYWLNANAERLQKLWL